MSVCRHEHVYFCLCLMYVCFEFCVFLFIATKVCLWCNYSQGKTAGANKKFLAFFIKQGNKKKGQNFVRA